MTDTERMKELVALLNEASEAYYAKNSEIMSNFEYDRLYDELKTLEEKTGVTLSNSPTVNVGYTAVEELPKERHEKPMLSLDKTKSREELRDWLGDQTGLLSWKLDGLTVVLTYENGGLIKAVTRGNGEIGEVITPNARVFENIPHKIPYRGKLILRGEAIIKYSDFEKINEQLEEEAIEEGRIEDVRYKNPRNLCSGSVRQLNNAVTARRHVNLFPFALVFAENVDFHNSREEQFRFLSEQGFEVVEYVRVTKDTLLDAIADFEKRIGHYDVPSDGLVLLLDDIAYGESLGTTAKFPRNAMAFKWADETQETILRAVEWSASRTGLINPVAVFDPVELEGTTVRRASVHNVSIVKSLKLGIGDHLQVYKANMIIPQIARNLTQSGTLEIPKVCPVCGGPTQIRNENDAQSLFCMNPDCPAKKLKSFTLFVSRPAMNIDGLSEATLEKFISRGFIHTFADIYHLKEHRDEIAQMEGFGTRSAAKICDSVERSRHTSLRRVLTAMGIPGIGPAGVRLLCRYFHNNLKDMLAADENTLSQIDGIGPVLAANFTEFFHSGNHLALLQQLLQEVVIDQDTMSSQTAESGTPDNGSGSSAASKEEVSTEGTEREPSFISLEGKTVVITGSLVNFSNRDDLKNVLEDMGAHVAGSVSAKTSYLINNDVNSTSSKNTKAQKLGIPILSENDFLRMCGREDLIHANQN